MSAFTTPSAGANPTTSSSSTKGLLLDIHLLCMNDLEGTAFATAAAKHFPALPAYTKMIQYNCALKYVPQNVRFDAIVSPANSYARLDGAFDDALARAYGPPGDYDWITRKAQKLVYERYRGYAPPGTCTIVPLDHDDAPPRGAMGWGGAEPRNPWGTKYLLLSPTMRVPMDVDWDREVVYDCIWSLLCAVDLHNREVKRQQTPGATEIRSVMMTPLATGVGQVSAKRWAEQCVLAMKQWVAAVERPEVWSQVKWDDAFRQFWEVEATYKHEIDGIGDTV